MNSLTKRLMAGVAAAATLLSGMALAGSAIADGAGNFTEVDLSATQTLTVTDSTNKDLTGKNLLPIRLAKYTAGQYDENDKITGYDVETMDDPSGLKTAIYDAAKAVAGTEHQNEVSKDNPMLWVVQNLSTISTADGSKTGNSSASPYSGTLRDFLTALAKSDVVKNAQPSEGNSYMTVDTDATAGSKATATVAPGIYAIMDKTSTAADADGTKKTNVASIPMMTGTAIGTNGKYNTLSNGTTLGTIEYKATLPTITKEITASGSTQGTGNVANTGENKNKVSDLAIGDDVTYTLTTKVPNYTGYDKYYLAMNDTLGDGLTLKPDSFTVNVEGSTGNLVKDTGYKVNVDGQKFTILFAPTTSDPATSNLVQTDATKILFPVGKTITVTYKATLNQKAVIGNASESAGNPNAVNLEYSNNPGTDDHGKTEDINVKSYTGALTIQKRDPNGAVDAKLAGSTFTIKKKNADTNLKFTGSDGTYTLAPSGTEGASETLTVPASGNITINGLDGEYTITEKSSAYGATIGLPSFDAKVTVNQENGNVTVTNTADANNLVTANSTAAQDGAVTVKNVHNFTEMPKTGATWLCIYAAMAVLCGGGAFLLLRSSKKRA